MYMFDLNWRLILWAIIAPIQIKHLCSRVSYQQATHHEYVQRDQESPSETSLCPPPLPSYSMVNHTKCNWSINDWWTRTIGSKLTNAMGKYIYDLLPNHPVGTGMAL